MAEATLLADSKSTSPTIRSSTTLMPTSTTTAPLRSIFPVMRPGVPGRDDDDLRVLDVAREVRRLRVADRDRRVLPHQEQGGGLADDVRAADDDDARARRARCPSA